MKNITNTFLAITLAAQGASLYADHHLEEAPLSSGAMTILNLVAEDPSAYIEFQRGNSEVLEELGVLLAGACVAVSGN